MASASNSAGIVGKWGQASYVPINSSTKRATPKKFFRSKNAESNRTDLTPVRMATTPKGSKFATPMSVPKRALRENRKCSVAVRVRPMLGEPSSEESVTEINDAVGEVSSVDVSPCCSHISHLPFLFPVQTPVSNQSFS